MKLRERKLVLKHMDKLARNMEKAKTDTAVKLPEKAEEVSVVCFDSFVSKDFKNFSSHKQVAFFLNLTTSTLFLTGLLCSLFFVAKVLKLVPIVC